MKINKLFFYSFLILYLEFTYKIAVYNNIWGINIVYTILFSIPIIFLLTLISSLFKNKVNKIITFIMTSILCIYFIFQYIFYNLFSVPFSFQTIGLANQALDFTNIIIDTLAKNILMLIVFLLPIILLIIFRNKISFNRIDLRKSLICLGLVLVFYTISILSLQFDKDRLYSVYNIYFNIKEERKTILEFGLITATRLDIKRTIFGFSETILLENSDNGTNIDNQIDVPKETTYNKLELNFDSLIIETNNTEKKNLLE